MSVADAVVAFVTGLLAGAFAGLLGVGGGIVMVPALVILLDRSQHVAQGTSLLVIVATAAVGTRANIARGLLDRRAAVLLGAGGAAGAIVGAMLALDVVGEDVLRRIFGAVLIVVAVQTLRPARAGSAGTS